MRHRSKNHRGLRVVAFCRCRNSACKVRLCWCCCVSCLLLVMAERLFDISSLVDPGCRSRSARNRRRITQRGANRCETSTQPHTHTHTHTFSYTAVISKWFSSDRMGMAIGVTISISDLVRALCACRLLLFLLLLLLLLWFGEVRCCCLLSVVLLQLLCRSWFCLWTLVLARLFAHKLCCSVFSS